MSHVRKMDCKESEKVMRIWSTDCNKYSDAD